MREASINSPGPAMLLRLAKLSGSDQPTGAFTLEYLTPSDLRCLPSTASAQVSQAPVSAVPALLPCFPHIPEQF